MFNKRVKQNVGALVLFSQLFSALTPVLTFAAPQAVSGGDIQNALESVGTKANRLKTIGASGVDESTGAFTYSYPFTLPKGLNGLQPDITLSYNSQNTDNTFVGYGWNLAIPYIERTAKYGVDKIYTKNDFVSSLGGELILKTGTTNQYIQKIDDGSYQLYTLNSNIWTLTDRSGNIYTFGTTLDSRLSDPINVNRIQKYYLTEVKDILGNKIKYFYEKKNGVVYPKEIIYTVKKDGTYSHKVIFEREERADKDVSYKSGFRTEMTDRIKTIRVYNSNFDNNFVEVAKLDLTYTTGQNGTRSLLSAFKESRVGTDGVWTTIPETKMEYEKGENLSFASGTYLSPGYSMIDLNGDGKLEQVNLDANNNGNSYTSGDFDGNYLADLYFKHQTYECWSGTKSIGIIKMNYNGQLKDFDLNLSDYKNLPTTHFTNYPCSGEASQSFSTPQIQDMNGDGFQDISNPFVSSSSPSEYMEDINGDGLVDKTGTYASTTRPEINGEYFFLNNGSGWNNFPELNYKIPFTYKIKSSYNKDWDGGFRLVDLNADGLVDLIKSWKSTQQSGGQVIFLVNGPAGRGYYQPEIAYPGSQNEVYLNTGNSFVKADNINLNGNFVVNYGGTFYNNYGYNPDGTVSFTGATWAGGVNTEQFYDTNGDGSLDFGGGASSFKKQDILKTVVSPLGSKAEIIYKGSVNGNNPKLPINILTVSEIKNTEVNKNISELVKYSYENGKMYFDKNNVYDRRFAGFEKVTTEQGTKKTVKYFHQGDGDNAITFERGDSFHNIGSVFKEEVYGGTIKYAETYRTYGVYNWDSQIFKYPKLEVVTEFDKSGNSFSKATTYDYDLVARLPKKTENFGEVKWDITTGNFSDVGEDYVLTKNIYNTKRPQKLLVEESLDINGKFLDKKIYFYDELPFGYVEKGLLSEERNYSSANNYVKTNYTYNINGLVENKIENNGAITTFTYDANHNPTAVKNTLNQITKSEYNKVLGLATKITDANGKIIQTVYDGFGNVKSISQTSSKDDVVKIVATKNISYTNNGMIETESIYNDSNVYKISVKNYDSFGRLIKSQNTNTDSSNQTIDIVYNSLGQIEKVTYPYDSNNILSGYFSQYDTKYIYDELGRNVEVGQGDLKNFTSYFVNGKATSDNSSEQHKKEYKYNSLGKLISVKEYTSSSNFLETKYDWNLLGNLIKITDTLGNVRNFVYDSEGRLLKQEDLHTPADNTFGVYSYTYDVNGLLTSKKDPSANIATFEYDLLNRPVVESFGNITTYTYDTCENGTGKLCSVENSDYTQNLEYNKNGNILSEIKIIKDQSGDKTFENKFEYNDLGQNTKIILPDNSQINYSYDVNGKQKTASLTRIINNTASTTQIVTDSKYNIDGTVKSLTQGNNVKTCYEYSGVNGGNVLPRLSKINVVNNNDCNTTEEGKLLFSQDLKYNLFGSIIENKEIIGANNFNSGIQNEFLNKYTYDILQRLTKSERQDGSINTFNELTYNSIGNIISSDSTQYSYTGADYQNPHAPSIIGNTVMNYDLNGNILGDGKNNYEWNLKNTLKKVSNEKSITEYIYDVSGERIKEMVKVKTDIATENFENSGTLTYEGEEIFASYENIISTTSEKYFMSKQAYEEIKNLTKVATVTTEIIKNLISPVYSSAFVNNACKEIKNSDKEKCLRDTTLKVVYTKNKKQNNYEISFGTLQEIWGVLRGQLAVPGDVSIYSDLSNRKFTIILDSTNSTSYNGNTFGNYKENGLYLNFYSDSRPIIYWDKLNLVDKDLFEVANATLTLKNLANTSTLVNVYEVSSPIDISNVYFKPATTSTNIISNSQSVIDGGYGWWTFSVSVRDFIDKQDKGENFYGLVLEKKSSDITSFQTYSNNYSWDVAKPKIEVEYQFIGKMVAFNATTTKVVSEENVDSYYEQIISKIDTHGTEKQIPYISESSYNELKTNKLNSQNKVEMLFALALEGNKYVKDICKSSIDKDCQKKESIKFVASYLYTKHNIKLAAQTLEEMYEVYVGNLKLSRSADIYSKKELGIIASENRSCNIYQSEPNCLIGINLSTTTGKNYVSTFKYSINAWFGTFSPVDIVINNEKVVSSKLVTAQESIIVDDYIRKAKDANTLNNFKIEIKGIFTNWSGMFVSGSLEVKEFVYLNKNINQNKNVLVTDTDLKTKVYADVSVATTDKNLLGYIFKQKTVASLFGSEKLISKETFNEISSLGFTYSDLIIKDMLIDVSFVPYTSCENISNDIQKRNCRKEIFVKYLFAIIKYETDKEISTITLDELFEVTEGNLSVPNNLEDYKIRNTQVFNLNSTENTHVLAGYYGYAVDAYHTQHPYRIGCQSGFSRPGQENVDNVCDISFVVPADLLARKNDVEFASINLLGTQGRGDYYNPNVFNAGQVYLYPVISNNNFSYNGSYIPASALYAWNTNQNIVSASADIKLGESIEADITKVINAIVKGEVNNFGLRIISTGNNIVYTNNGKYELKVDFVKDAEQNKVEYFTPLVSEPYDADIANKILEKFARVDKDYETEADAFISGGTFSILTLINIKTSEEVKKIFEENEKLQKDDTLKTVWEYFRDNASSTVQVSLSRESLEELFMVWKNKLEIPLDESPYQNNSTSTKKIFSQNTFSNLSIVEGVPSPRGIDISAGYKKITDYDVTKIEEVLLISPDTKGELLLANINNQDEVKNIFSLSTSTDKQEKLDFVKKYVKENKNYEISVEALEEMFLIDQNKIIFLDNISTTSQRFEKRLTHGEEGVEILGLTNKVNNNKNTCTISYYWGYRQVINSYGQFNQLFTESNDCIISFEIKKIPGYEIDFANIEYSGFNTDPNIPRPTTTINGKIVNDLKISGNLTLSEYGNLKNKFNIVLENNYFGVHSANPTFVLTVNYKPIEKVFDRSIFSTLSEIEIPLIETFAASSALATSTEATSTDATSSEEIIPTLTPIQSPDYSIFFDTDAQNRSNVTYKEVVVTDTVRATTTKEVIKYRIVNEIVLATSTVSELVATTTLVDVLVPVYSTATITSNIVVPKTIVIGQAESENSDKKWDEFKTEKLVSRTNVMGTIYYSQLKNIIGMLDKQKHVQEFTFNNLNIGSVQSIDINFGASLRDKTYQVVVVHGTADITVGQKFFPTNSINTNVMMYLNSKRRISFVPQTSTVILRIEPVTTSFDNYFRPDQYILRLNLASTTTQYIPQTSYITEQQATTTYVSVNREILVEKEVQTEEQYVEYEVVDYDKPIYKILIQALDSVTGEVLATSTESIQETNNLMEDYYKQLKLDFIHNNLVNPYSYPYIINPETLEVQYQVGPNIYSTNPYYKHYPTLASKLHNTETEEDLYTKFYPSAYYEYDSRGIVTINIPFNGKVVGTYKYDTNTNSTIPAEISYIHNSYNATPVLITNSIGSTTEVIKRDVWGSMINNNYNENDVIATSFGLTGHKADEHSKLTYAHSRYLSNENKVWLSHDPYSITNFTNGTWLMNPQIQNSYSYASNNPINMVDPDGQKPTPEEAARMSAQIYDTNHEGDNLSGGWSYNYAMYGGDNLKMGVYSRSVDGKTEYAVAYRGTTKRWSDVKNDIQQPFGWSADAKAAMSQAGKVMDELGNAEVTFTGHSEGGAYAQLSGVKYGKNVMVFNSARPFYGQYGLTLEVIMYANGSKKIEPYRVDGEILGIFNNVFFGAYAMPMGGNISLPSQGLYNTSAPSTPGITSYKTTSPVSNSFMSPLQNSFNDHSSKSVLHGVTSKSW